MGDVLDITDKKIEDSLELIDSTEKKFILSRAESFNKKDVYERIKQREKVALFSLNWGDSDEICLVEKTINLFLGNNIKFCVLVEITNKNHIYLEEIVEFLKNKNSRNIILGLADRKEDMVKFDDIKKRVAEVIANTDFKINIEGFPLCFLDENKDHATHIMKESVKIKRCSLCELNFVCNGIGKGYLEKFGDDEIKPVNKLKEGIIRVRKKIDSNSLVYVSDDDIYYLLKEIEKDNDFWAAVENLGYPLAIAIEMINEMEKEGILSVNGNDIKLNVELEKNKNEVRDFSKLRLRSDPEASQLIVEQKDLVKRVEYIIEKCPSGGKIVFLGDDDFISLSMASKNHFEKIVVLEFDEKIAEKIREISKKEDYVIEVITHDLRKELPGKLSGKFDVFYTDSPYSMNGFGLFISRGIELLKNEPKKHGFASFSCEMPEMEMVEIPSQNMINKMKLFIERKNIGASNVIPKELKALNLAELREKIDNFKELSKQERWYLGALARKEYLFHFLTTNQTIPLIKGDFDGELYFTDYALNFYVDDELKKELRKNPVFDWKNGN